MIFWCSTQQTAAVQGAGKQFSCCVRHDHEHRRAFANRRQEKQPVLNHTAAPFFVTAVVITVLPSAGFLLSPAPYRHLLLVTNASSSFFCVACCSAIVLLHLSPCCYIYIYKYHSPPLSLSGRGALITCLPVPSLSLSLLLSLSFFLSLPGHTAHNYYTEEQEELRAEEEEDGRAKKNAFASSAEEGQKRRNEKARKARAEEGILGAGQGASGRRRWCSCCRTPAGINMNGGGINDKTNLGR